MSPAMVRIAGYMFEILSLPIPTVEREPKVYKGFFSHSQSLG